MAKKPKGSVVDNWPSRFEIELRYASRTCGRCGGTRLATKPCPECGKRPDEREVDVAVQRRQRVAGPVLTAFAVPSSATTGETPLDAVLEASGSIVPRFLNTLASLAANGEDTTPLLQVLSDLAGLKGEVTADRARPWRRVNRLVRKYLDEVSDALSLFLMAFGADTEHVPSLVELG